MSSYFKQIKSAYEIMGLSHDRGEVPLNQREGNKHLWDDCDEPVRVKY